MSDIDPTRLDPTALSPQEFARLVRDAPPADLGELMAGPMRRPVLDEVFRRMREQFVPSRAGNRSAVVHWTITIGDGYARASPPDSEPDRYELTIADGGCAVAAPPEREPQLTLVLNGVDFLRLTSGNADAITLFTSRRLTLDGDLGLGAGLLAMFDIPKP